MPEIEVRPAVPEDLPGIMALEPGYASDHVWQMEIEVEDGLVGVNFREVRLPRSVRVEYPRSPARFAESWPAPNGLLVALHTGEIIGMTNLVLNKAPLTTWMTDLIVARHMRRKGIGSSLVIAALDWGRAHETRRLVLEIQTKNHAAIRLVQKLGFDFVGYNDRYYANQDIALFFAKYL